MMLPFVFQLLVQFFGLSPAIIDSDISSGCSTSGPASCHWPHVPDDTCCNEYPSGLLLQTQFWNFDVPGSPSDSWTIHGLWNNKCNGGYSQFCDDSREYNITELLIDQGETSTLDYMRHYWLNNNGDHERLWNHEWFKHGTCFSTLEPDCLDDESPEGAEAVAYFQTTIDLFQSLPTYTWLADDDIVPSESETYRLSDILSALRRGSGGYTPDVGCRGRRLNRISWYYNLKGSAIDGEFILIDSPNGEEGSDSCPYSGIEYPPNDDDEY